MSAQQCRNCGSTDWYEQEVDARGGYGPDLMPIKLGLFTKLRVKYRLQVCGACGLTEWFVPERFLTQLKDAFLKRASSGR